MYKRESLGMRAMREMWSKREKEEGREMKKSGLIEEVEKEKDTR